MSVATKDKRPRRGTELVWPALPSTGRHPSMSTEPP